MEGESIRFALSFFNMSMKKLVFASHNKHKAQEIANLLNSEYEISTLDEIGLTEEIAETAETLEGNALIKARYVYEKTCCDCFADDTGLIVDAIGGAPGVYSARFAGEDGNAERNMAKLLAMMDGKDNRAARFKTVVVYISDGKEYVFDGIVEGEITTEKHGNEGFGYDPVFAPVEAGGKTFAEMTLDEKNLISHRARAVKKFVEFLKGRN